MLVSEGDLLPQFTCNVARARISPKRLASRTVFQHDGRWTQPQACKSFDMANSPTTPDPHRSTPSKWPPIHRNPRDFVTRVQAWYEDYSLFFRLPQAGREDLLASARDVFEKFSAEERMLADVDDAETSLQTLELQFGEGSLELQDRREGLSDAQLVAISVNPWLDLINEEDGGRGKGKPGLRSGYHQPLARDGMQAVEDWDGGSSRKRRKIEEDHDGRAGDRSACRDETPDIVVSSPEGSPEPVEGSAKRQRLFGRTLEL